MTDRCALCFRVLEPAPLGGRYACTNKAHRSARRRPYWSEAIPEAPSACAECPLGPGAACNEQCEGGYLDASLVSKHGRPTLHLYGP